WQRSVRRGFGNDVTDYVDVWYDLLPSTVHDHRYAAGGCSNTDIYLRRESGSRCGSCCCFFSNVHGADLVRERTMKRILVWAMLALVVVLSVPLFADGTVTTPISVTATSWKIGHVSSSTGAGNGPAGIQITIFTGAGAAKILSRQPEVGIIANVKIVPF